LRVNHPQDSGREQAVNVLFMGKNQKIVAVVHYDTDLTYYYSIEVSSYHLFLFLFINMLKEASLFAANRLQNF
jgi:hypothetical protein